MLLQPDAITATATLQDLADACLVVNASAADGREPRYYMHPLVWDFAERDRRVQLQPQQLAALEAFLRWLLVCSDRLATTRLRVGSPAQIAEARQLVADALPNFSVLVAQLRHLLISAEDSMSGLIRLAMKLIMIGQQLAANGDDAAALGQMVQRLQGMAEAGLGREHPVTLDCVIMSNAASQLNLEGRHETQQRTLDPLHPAAQHEPASV